MSGVVGRPSRMSGSGRVALLVVREWLEDTPGCPGVVGGPPGSPGGLVDVREALPEVQEA